jgi:hypothetical protein
LKREPFFSIGYRGWQIGLLRALANVRAFVMKAAPPKRSAWTLENMQPSIEARELLQTLGFRHKITLS